MKIAASVLFLLILLCGRASADNEKTMYTYQGELNGIPCRLGLAWVSPDDVVGYLERLDGQKMILRLSGENATQGTMKLQASQRTKGEGLMTLSKGSDDGKTRWEGTMKFNDGTSLPIWFVRSK